MVQETLKETELHMECIQRTAQTGKIHYIVGFKEPDKVIMCDNFFPARDYMSIHYIYFPEKRLAKTSDTVNPTSDAYWRRLGVA